MCTEKKKKEIKSSVCHQLSKKYVFTSHHSRKTVALTLHNSLKKTNCVVLYTYCGVVILIYFWVQYMPQSSFHTGSFGLHLMQKVIKHLECNSTIFERCIGVLIHIHIQSLMIMYGVIYKDSTQMAELLVLSLPDVRHA